MFSDVRVRVCENRITGLTSFPIVSAVAMNNHQLIKKTFTPHSRLSAVSVPCQEGRRASRRNYNKFMSKLWCIFWGCKCKLWSRVGFECRSYRSSLSSWSNSYWPKYLNKYFLQFGWLEKAVNCTITLCWTNSTYSSWNWPGKSAKTRDVSRG